MTKKEFIKTYSLKSDGSKILVIDGLRHAWRTLYEDPYGNYFVFYGNDLHTVRVGIHGAYLGAGYSWYK